MSGSEAYRIIKKLNTEPEQQGYIVISGRVNHRYRIDTNMIPEDKKRFGTHGITPGKTAF